MPSAGGPSGNLLCRRRKESRWLIHVPVFGRYSLPIQREGVRARATRFVAGHSYATEWPRSRVQTRRSVPLVSGLTMVREGAGTRSSSRTTDPPKVRHHTRGAIRRPGTGLGRERHQLQGEMSATLAEHCMFADIVNYIENDQIVLDRTGRHGVPSTIGLVHSLVESSARGDTTRGEQADEQPARLD